MRLAKRSPSMLFRISSRLAVLQMGLCRGDHRLRGAVHEVAAPRAVAVNLHKSRGQVFSSQVIHLVPLTGLRKARSGGFDPVALHSDKSLFHPVRVDHCGVYKMYAHGIPPVSLQQTACGIPIQIQGRVRVGGQDTGRTALGHLSV